MYCTAVFRMMLLFKGTASYKKLYLSVLYNRHISSNISFIMINQLDNDYSNFIMIVKTVDLETLPASHFFFMKFTCLFIA